MGGILAIINKPTPLGGMTLVVTAKDVSNNAVQIVGLGQPIKIIADLYDQLGNKPNQARVYAETPRQASFGRKFDNPPYIVDYVATSTGVHEIEFWTVDPVNSTNVRDVVVSKKVILTVQ